MSEHLSSDQMNRYARRGLPPAELLLVDDHVVGCPACRGELSDESGVLDAIRSLREDLVVEAAAGPDHLGYDQMEAAVERRLSGPERDAAEAHLGLCRACAAEADDLRRFVQQIDTAAREARRPDAPATADRRGAASRPAAARAAEPETAEEAPESLSLLPHEPSVWRSTAVLVPLAIVLTLAVVAGAAFFASASFRRRLSDLRAQLDEQRRSGESLAQKAAEAEQLRGQLAQMQAADQSRTTPLLLQDKHGPVGLDASGDLVGLDALSIGDGRAIATALRRQAVEIPDGLRDLIGEPRDAADLAAGAPGGEAAAAEFGPITPVGTLIRSQRPTFSWRALPGAGGYTVSVYDASSNPISRSDLLTGTSWKPPRPLKRGVRYGWQVTARQGATAVTAPEPPAHGAAFQVLDAPIAAGLDRSVRAADGSRLAAGILFARAGLLDEAETELKALAEANPDSSLARDLWRSLIDARRATSGRTAEPGR